MIITLEFDFKNISNKILKTLILKRAYKGYVYYNKLEYSIPLSFERFKKFDLWKIKFYFQIYLERIAKVKSLGFNPSNKSLFKFWRK